MFNVHSTILTSLIGQAGQIIHLFWVTVKCLLEGKGQEYRTELGAHGIYSC